MRVYTVTDGKEECKGNPAAVVSELLAQGFEVRLNIVGFALADAATKREMEDIARLTGGRFFDAKDARGLRAAIQEALALPFEVLDATGAKVQSGVTGQGGIDVPEGVYTIVIAAAGGPITIPEVRVAHGKSTMVELKKEGQAVGVRVVGP